MSQPSDMAAFVRIVETATSLDPAQRYQSIGEMMSALSTFVSSPAASEAATAEILFAAEAVPLVLAAALPAPPTIKTHLRSIFPGAPETLGPPARRTPRIG